jgi:hypothetical protein
MPPKKIKQQPPNQSDTLYVVLRDNKKSCSRVVPQDKLSYTKKDNLKLGTFATYKEDGNLSSRFRGIVIMSGKLYESICY